MDSRVCGRCSVSDESSDSCSTLPNNIEKLPTFSEHPREPGIGLDIRSNKCSHLEVTSQYLFSLFVLASVVIRRVCGGGRVFRPSTSI